jgi:hypothetical protein
MLVVVASAVAFLVLVAHEWRLLHRHAGDEGRRAAARPARPEGE